MEEVTNSVNNQLNYSHQSYWALAVCPGINSFQYVILIRHCGCIFHVVCCI